PEEFSAINIIGYTASISLKNILLKQRANESACDAHEKKRHLARNSRRTSDILELSSKLSSVSTYDGILSEVLNAYSSIFSIEQAAVMNVNNQKKEIFIEHAIGFKSSFVSDYRSPEDRGLIGSSIQKATPYFRRGPIERTPELAVIPFSGVSGLPSGAVVLYDRSLELLFSEDDFETMWLISNIMAIALNALKIKSLNTARAAGRESETKNLEALLNIVAPSAGIKGVFERSFEILTELIGQVSFSVASEESEGKLRFAYFYSPKESGIHAGYISSGDAFIKKALESSSPQLFYCEEDIKLDDGASAAGTISGTTAVIPLSAPSNRFAYIISRVPSDSVEKINDRDLLALIARTLEKALEYEAGYRESASRNYNETQNIIAREIQKKLLPQSIVSTPKFQIEAYCEAAIPVGGDYYDIIHNEAGNTISVLLADISGRGINSAMIAAMIRTQIHTLIKNNFDARKLLYNLNNLICDDIDLYNFITLFFLQLSLTGNRAAFCNAAHNPILHYINDGHNVVAHESRNSPLGILKNMEFKEGILLLDSGDILLLYTNGLAEIKNPAGDFFGRERLVSFIQDNAELSARDFKEKLLKTIFEYSNSIQHEDDITFVIVKVV
ncbi:MAG TPA: PP2C family protein-serine/threonine phosphatase, partial [Candidatus Wallbacteria bacterium]|nr:PP2C family protein-serine/threonine phosphatase [Candidatus Wallbacteria bacterium]